MIGDFGVAIVRGVSLMTEAWAEPDSNPRKIAALQADRVTVDEVHADAGDCVIFAEAVSHLTLPWHGDHQRRALCAPTTPITFSPLT